MAFWSAGETTALQKISRHFLNTQDLFVLLDRILRFDRVGRPCGRQGFRIGFHTAKHLFDSAFQLQVLSFEHRFRVIVNLNIRCDAFAFDDVLAVFVVRRGKRYRHFPAVDQRATTGNSDDTAPASFADQLAQAGFAEIVRKMSPSDADVSLIKQVNCP